MLIQKIAPNISYRREFAIFGVVRTTALFVLVGAMLGAAAAHAKVNVYTVRGVQVDSTARTAAAARVLAIDEGHSRAFQRLMRRLLPRDSVAQVPEQSRGALAALVSNFEVEEEKTSSVRYLAKLTFRFKRDAVRDLLRNAGLSFAEAASRPVLILPVYRVGGLNLLWDKPNPWLKAWSDLPESEGLVPLVVPKGDLGDVSAISANQALEGNFERLSAIVRRYNAGGVIVAVAFLTRLSEEGTPVLQVGTIRYAGVQQEQDPVQTYTTESENPGPELMAIAARATAEGVQEGWKAENLLRFDRQNEITVTVPLQSLSDWVQMENALRRITVIQSSRLISMSRRSAVVRLSYLGEQSRLRVALARGNLQLQQGAADWILRSMERQRGTTR